MPGVSGTVCALWPAGRAANNSKLLKIGVESTLSSRAEEGKARWGFISRQIISEIYSKRSMCAALHCPYSVFAFEHRLIQLMTAAVINGAQQATRSRNMLAHVLPYVLPCAALVLPYVLLYAPHVLLHMLPRRATLFCASCAS